MMAVKCMKCGKTAEYPDTAKTWEDRADYIDSLMKAGWTIKIFEQTCPDCKGGDQ